MPEIRVARNDQFNQPIWIDADQDADDIQSDIELMLTIDACSLCGNDGDGEHVGHDYEPDIVKGWEIVSDEGFSPITIQGSGYSLAEISEMGQAIAEHGDAYRVWVFNTGTTDPKEFEEAFHGEYDDAAAYGKEYFDGVYGIGRLEELSLDQFIDWYGYGEWILVDVDHSWYNDRLYVWRN